MILSSTRYWHTLRHLKFRQLFNRVWRRIYRPKPNLQSAPVAQIPSVFWLRCQRPASLTGTNVFNLLNVENRIERRSDWNHPTWPKLWLYNLHYFDDLNAENAAVRNVWHIDLVKRWIAENPPGQGIGWEPYPSALRIVNWIQWAWAGNRLDDDALDSLAVQSRWLASNLEYHLLGNHLWANAKALCFAGSFFGGDEGARWRDKGAALIAQELREQVLPDGGHFERSPMYHAIVLTDVLDLIQLARFSPAGFKSELVQAFHDAAQRMRHWMQLMSHPDGEIAFFNDSTLGVSPTPGAIEAYASVLGLPPVAPLSNGCTLLQDSGFLRLQNARAVMLADVGAVAPDYIPGHAHAGTLSFELSLDGNRLLVNSGISTYANDEERRSQRGTAAHNTVTVGGRNSSEVWAAFRVARRVRNVIVQTGSASETWAEANHDGYRSMGIWHRRRWCLGERGLSVHDHLEGPVVDAVAYFHWAPLPPSVSLQTDGLRTTEESSWHSGFNRSERIRRESITFRQTLVTELNWGP